MSTFVEICKKKILVFVEISVKFQFWILARNFPEIALLVEIFEKSLLWSKFAKNIDFGQILRNSHFLSKNAKISIFVESKRKSRFWSKFATNLGFGRNFWKSRFWSKFLKNREFIRYFRKIPILFEIFRKISILVEICKKSRFRSNFVKISILFEMCENLDFGRNFENLDLDPKWSKSSKKPWFWSKFSKNLDLGRNLPKISILVEICLKSRFWSKFYDHLDFGRNIREKLNKDFRKISILPKFSKKTFCRHLQKKFGFRWKFP